MSSPTSSPQISRPVQIALGVAVAIGVLYALYAFVISPLLGGDDEPLPDVVGSGQVVTGETPADGELPTDETAMDGMMGTPVPETFEIFSARDPFQQLVVEAGSAAAAAAASDTAPSDGATAEPTAAPTAVPSISGSSSSSGSGSTPSTPADPTSTEPPGAPGVDDEGDQEGTQTQGGGAGEIYEPVGPQAATTTVTLLDVDDLVDTDERATVEVDGTAHTVAEGQVFADRFQLLDIEAGCATLLFGDSRFTLCEGETIRK